MTDDLRTIKIKASIKSNMKEALRENTQFWLVTPKASLAGVSGLDALVGGNYIGMMPGEGKPRENFVALDTQPKYRVNSGEMLIHLQAPDLGGLNSGSLVYFRKIPVGRVYDYSINSGSKGVTVDVLIERRSPIWLRKRAVFGMFPASGPMSVWGSKGRAGKPAGAGQWCDCLRLARWFTASKHR